MLSCQRASLAGMTKIENIMKTKVKICGITTEQDAKLALSLGADFIGFIFHEASARHITYEQAEEIMIACNYPSAIGIFINQSKEEVEDVARRLKLWGVQLYQDQTILSSTFKIIRVIRVKDQKDLDKIATFKKTYPTDYILLDAYHPSQMGGSGQTFDWSLLPADLSHCFLSGGINIRNVKQALAQHPFAIDLSSGVESTPGKKDPDKLTLLFKEIHHEK